MISVKAGGDTGKLWLNCREEYSSFLLCHSFTLITLLFSLTARKRAQVSFEMFKERNEKVFLR